MMTTCHVLLCTNSTPELQETPLPTNVQVKRSICKPCYNKTIVLISEQNLMRSYFDKNWLL